MSIYVTRPPTQIRPSERRVVERFGDQSPLHLQDVIEFLTTVGHAPDKIWGLSYRVRGGMQSPVAAVSLIDKTGIHLDVPRAVGRQIVLSQYRDGVFARGSNSLDRSGFPTGQVDDISVTTTNRTRPQPVTEDTAATWDAILSNFLAQPRTGSWAVPVAFGDLLFDARDLLNPSSPVAIVADPANPGGGVIQVPNGDLVFVDANGYADVLKNFWEKLVQFSGGRIPERVPGIPIFLGAGNLAIRGNTPPYQAPISALSGRPVNAIPSRRGAYILPPSRMQPTGRNTVYFGGVPLSFQNIVSRAQSVSSRQNIVGSGRFVAPEDDSTSPRSIPSLLPQTDSTESRVQGRMFGTEPSLIQSSLSTIPAAVTSLISSLASYVYNAAKPILRPSPASQLPPMSPEVPPSLKRMREMAESGMPITREEYTNTAHSIAQEIRLRQQQNRQQSVRSRPAQPGEGEERTPKRVRNTPGIRKTVGVPRSYLQRTRFAPQPLPPVSQESIDPARGVAGGYTFDPTLYRGSDEY